MTLYLQLAETLGSRIEQGLYRPGDRLPSVRAMSIEHGVSLSTVQQAYRLLEDRGLAEPRPKSGYFVPVARQMPPLPAIARLAQRPVEISNGSRCWPWSARYRGRTWSSSAAACRTSPALR
ncbi:winged helix-turn-helix domain-containing protein [Pseudomonas aeruginosa]|nr:winged helix-turn-helix domain-containing protein [Pseudomonas aeruginosa]